MKLSKKSISFSTKKDTKRKLTYTKSFSSLEDFKKFQVVIPVSNIQTIFEMSLMDVDPSEREKLANANIENIDVVQCIKKANKFYKDLYDRGATSVWFVLVFRDEKKSF